MQANDGRGWTENPGTAGHRTGGTETTAGPGAGTRAKERNAERNRRADERIARRIAGAYPDAIYTAVIQQCEWTGAARAARAARIARIATDAISIFE